MRGAVSLLGILGYGGLILIAPAAAAQTADKAQPKPSLVGEFSDWAAYSYKTPTGQVCYIVSQPKKSEPEGAKRDPVFFLVTHRPGDNVRNEVNTIIGYAFPSEECLPLLSLSFEALLRFEEEMGPGPTMSPSAPCCWPGHRRPAACAAATPCSGKWASRATCSTPKGWPS